MDFEQKMNEIDKILSKMQNGEINLAELSAEVEKVQKLISECKSELKIIHKQVEDLVLNVEKK